MKMPSAASLIFSLRTFTAAMLALYLSYRFDLARPTWAFITSYIVSAPLRGAGRSKGLYRICGTVVGAAFAVIAVPNLVNAPELLVLVISLWIAGCLYLSLIDGTPRSYGMMLAGYTAALIGFPSVTAPDTIFDTAISRAEEIGLAILCVELMGHLPFNQRASTALLSRIEKCLIDTRDLAVHLMTFNPHALSIADRARIMLEVSSLNALRIQAHYDTPYFSHTEHWVIHLQRHLRDFFADLVTFDAQLKRAHKANTGIPEMLRPVASAVLAWIETMDAEISKNLSHQLALASTDPARQLLVTTGILDTVTGIVYRRHECLLLRQKIRDREKNKGPCIPIATYIDHRQAAFYGIAVVFALMATSSFWIATAWPEGGVACMLGAVICCFFASLDAPPTVAFLFFLGTLVGTGIGYIYNFLVFPHIDGFPLLVFSLAISCIPIGIGITNPRLGGLMLPLILGINVADFQNRFEANFPGFLNGFLAQTLGIMFAGVVLHYVRVISQMSATRHLLAENRQALAKLSDVTLPISPELVDRMAHRSALVVTRAPALKKPGVALMNRALLDLQAERALIQIRELEAQMTPALKEPLLALQAKFKRHFANKKDRPKNKAALIADIKALRAQLGRESSDDHCLRLSGLIATLGRSLGEKVA